MDEETVETEVEQKNRVKQQVILTALLIILIVIVALITYWKFAGSVQ